MRKNAMDTGSSNGDLGRGFRRTCRRLASGALAAAALALAAVLAAPGTAPAQETAEERIEELEGQVEELRRQIAATDTAEIEELRRRLDAVVRQMEQMQLGTEVVSADTSVYGLAPAASKVYRTERGVSIGGYGEILYQNFADEREDGTPSGATDQADALRGITYVGYKFNDDLLFNSEIEVEHGSTSGGVGSVSLEFAYLDYRLSDRFGVRAGMLLPPMGFLNEIHEPPTFLGSTRPAIESAIIPSTWRENGIGLFGESGDLEYRAYVVNGLDAVGAGASPASGFSAAGLRGGRQKGAKALAEDLAAVGRVDWTGAPGLTVGTSAYLGESGQNADAPGAAEGTVGARTLIWEGHAQYRARGFDLRAMGTLASVDDAEQLNALHGYTGDESVGERLTGAYVQAGYNVLRDAPTSHQLLPYLRLEQLDTQAEVPEGFQADPANDRGVVSVGAAWKPVPGAVLKADYQMHSNEAETGTNQFNLAVGYLF